MVEWHQVEPLIEATEADALVIFDCCFAGSLQTFRAEIIRKYEILAACQYNEVTPAPGSNSFTSALIWAFQELKSSQGFDTNELKAKIREAPYFAKSHRQTPALWHRPRDHGEHIWISPQPAPGKITLPLAPSRPLLQYRQDRPMETLEVTIRFVKRLDERQVGKFARAFSRFIRNEGSELGIRRADVTGYASRFKDAGILVIRQNKGQMIRPDQSSQSDSLAGLPSNRATVTTVTTSAPASSGELEEQKDTNLPRGWVFSTMKAFVSGILLTLLFWCLFFYAPFRRLMALWSRGDGWMIFASGVRQLDQES